MLLLVLGLAVRLSGILCSNQCGTSACPIFISWHQRTDVCVVCEDIRQQVQSLNSRKQLPQLSSGHTLKMHRTRVSLEVDDNQCKGQVWHISRRRPHSQMFIWLMPSTMFNAHGKMPLHVWFCWTITYTLPLTTGWSLVFQSTLSCTALWGVWWGTATTDQLSVWGERHDRKKWYETSQA